MEKQKVRFHPHLRTIHRIIKSRIHLPDSLPLYVEVNPTTIKICDLDHTYELTRILFGWPGYRMEIYVRDFADGVRKIDSVTIFRNKRQPHKLNEEAIAEFPLWS